MDVYSNDKVAAALEPKAPSWAAIQEETLGTQRQTIEQLVELERFFFGDSDPFEIPTPTCTEHALVLTRESAIIISDRLTKIVERIGVRRD